MAIKTLVINLLFGATFFNHLHALKFIPQHNRPLLLLCFPLVIWFLKKYKTSISQNIIFWFSYLLLLTTFSLCWNIFFGDYSFYQPEAVLRYLSYIIIFYFFLIGILFKQNEKLISSKFYYFFIFIGVLQIYLKFNLPLSSIIINIFDNYLIYSFASVANHILFFEAEPSYVAFMIIFLMVFFERKNSFIWVFFSVLTISVRTTVVSILYYIKKNFYFFLSFFTLLIFILSPKIIESYRVSSRIKSIITIQSNVDPSTYIRLVNNKIALEIILDYPLFGVGPGQYSTYFSHKYLKNYDTRNIPELKQSLDFKTKIADPYSLILGLISELGILIFIWIFLSFAYLFFYSKRKYLVGVFLLILLWGYPFGKPYIWILFGYVFEEINILKKNN